VKPTTTCRAALLLAALSPQAIGQEQTPVQPPEGFTALFNGKNLDGWWGMSTEDPRKLFAMSKQQLAAEIAKSLPNIRQHWRAENGVLINDGKLASLRRFEDDVKEVKSGYECGIGIEKFNDIKPGDVFEFYVIEEFAATL